MSRSRRRTRNSEKPASVALPQLDRQVLRNRFAPVEPLDEEQINLIHEASSISDHRTCGTRLLLRKA